MNKPRVGVLPLVLIVLACAFLVATLLAVRVAAQDVQRSQQDLAPIAYAQSQTCQSCHPGHYETWHQTYHRTMTQAASDISVVGDFADAAYTYQGITSRFFMQDNRFYIETLGSDNSMAPFEIAMTVGSRRVQQYVTKVGDRHLRLPLAWNIEEARWFHLSSGFLHPDGADFNEHLALWDGNCIFCHNTKAQPNYDFATEQYDATVAEMGIACESCHGPAEAHVAANSNPVRRYLLHLTDDAEIRDPTLISPLELSAETQIQTCGHCHGQRLPNPPERIRSIFTDGDPFTVGDNLNDWFTPIHIESQLGDVDLSLRFWQDGTPRLTAYEYQGILASKHDGTDLTCTSCHNMHGGDPKGMIDPGMRGNLSCTQCHQPIADALTQHTKHAPDSSGSQCLDCHMPRTTYGVLDTHPSHQISNPEPARSWEHEMPEACTICHTNETALWAAEQVERDYGIGFTPPTEESVVAENVRALLSGDAVQRSVAAIAFSEVGSYTDDNQARMWAAPFLILTMERDNYPAVRHFAYRSLLALTEQAGYAVDDIEHFDHSAENTSRQPIVAAWWRWWQQLDKSAIPHPGPAVPLDSQLQINQSQTDALLAQRSNKIISIGE